MKRILLSVFAAAITAAWAIPASAADVTVGGQYRLRGEYRNNADFDANAKDKNKFYDQRVRLSANAKATEDTTVKITLQDSRRFGGGTTATQTAGAGGPGLTDNEDATTRNDLDLHESYVNIENLFGSGVALKAGRQEFVYGDERLIGAFGWSNNGRSFDAIKFVYKSDIVNADLFTSKLRDNSLTSGTAGNDNDQDFNGIYLSTKAVPKNTIDLYALFLRDGNHGAAATAFGISNTLGNTVLAGTLNNAQKLNTYGIRVKGNVADLDYTVELPIQRGTIKTTTNTYDIKSYAFAAKAGYTLPAVMKLRVGAEYDYASGDKDATDSDHEIKTFFNLFPTNHDKLGFMDQQGWRNVKAWNINASLVPMEKVTVIASYWDFTLAQKQDAWYGAGNWNNTPTGISAANANNGSSDIGNEVDLVAKYKYNSAAEFELGYGRFFAGKFIKDQITSTQDKKDQDWAYLMLTANF